MLSSLTLTIISCLQGPLAGTSACKFANAAGDTDPGFDACLVSL